MYSDTKESWLSTTGVKFSQKNSSVDPSKLVMFVSHSYTTTVYQTTLYLLNTVNLFPHSLCILMFGICSAKKQSRERTHLPSVNLMTIDFSSELRLI